jgi:translation initiation factor 1A
MGKNTGGGKKHKKTKSLSTHKRELRFKEDLEDYALVQKVLGDCRLECLCTDGTERICHIRGKFKKRVWMTVGDIVLISLREFQDNKADVIHKYTPEEATMLRDRGEISFKDHGVNALMEGQEEQEDDTLVIDMSTL